MMDTHKLISQRELDKRYIKRKREILGELSANERWRGRIDAILTFLVFVMAVGAAAFLG